MIQSNLDNINSDVFYAKDLNMKEQLMSQAIGFDSNL